MHPADLQGERVRGRCGSGVVSCPTSYWAQRTFKQGGCGVGAGAVLGLASSPRAPGGRTATTRHPAPRPAAGWLDCCCSALSAGLPGLGLWISGLRRPQHGYCTLLMPEACARNAGAVLCPRAVPCAALRARRPAAAPLKERPAPALPTGALLRGPQGKARVFRGGV